MSAQGIELQPFVQSLSRESIANLGKLHNGIKPLISTKKVNGKILWRKVEYTRLDRVIAAICKYTLLSCIFRLFRSINRKRIVAHLKEVGAHKNVVHGSKMHALLTRMNEWYKKGKKPFVLPEKKLPPQRQQQTVVTQPPPVDTQRAAVETQPEPTLPLPRTAGELTEHLNAALEGRPCSPEAAMWAKYCNLKYSSAEKNEIRRGVMTLYNFIMERNGQGRAVEISGNDLMNEIRYPPRRPALEFLVMMESIFSFQEGGRACGINVKVHEDDDRGGSLAHGTLMTKDVVQRKLQFCLDHHFDKARLATEFAEYYENYVNERKNILRLLLEACNSTRNLTLRYQEFAGQHSVNQSTLKEVVDVLMIECSPFVCQTHFTELSPAEGRVIHRISNSIGQRAITRQCEAYQNRLAGKLDRTQKALNEIIEKVNERTGPGKFDTLLHSLEWYRIAVQFLKSGGVYPRF